MQSHLYLYLVFVGFLELFFTLCLKVQRLHLVSRQHIDRLGKHETLYRQMTSEHH